MKKSTYILIALLIVLAGVAYLVTMKPGEKSISTEAGEAFVKIDSLAVDKIEIEAPASSVTLEKKGVEWFLQAPIAYRADQSNVANAIQQIKAMQVRNIVSSNQQKHGLFQVDSTGTQVVVYEKGAQKASFVLGKTGPTFSDLYARLTGSNDVVLVGGAQAYVFNRPIKEWRDRTIFSSPKETIRHVEFQFGDTTFALTFQDSTWNVGKDSVDASAVETLISSLSKFECDEFLDSIPSPRPKLTAQITVAGTQIRFHHLKETAKYVVQTSASPQWFEVQPWRADQVLKRKKELVKK
jgi:flagellar basal body-associated protein FliL